jgi:triosephosphate isomerase
MRRPIIAGNWKMNTDRDGAQALSRDVQRLTEQVRDVDIVLIPPSIFLSQVGENLSESKVQLGAQNCEYRSNGAFTGEISVQMLGSVNCSYVLCGHSERRTVYGESDGVVNAKLQAVLQGGLSPILCIGETKEERDQGKTMERIRTQLEKGLEGVSLEDMNRIVLAYDPVWAIGTGDTASPEQAQDVHRAIREWIERYKSKEIAANMRIQYGGSVKPENVDLLMKKPDIDGALVGGASLKAESFARIVRFNR